MHSEDRALRDHKRRMKRIAEKNREAGYKAKEKKAARYKKHISTSKIALFVMMAICFEIIIYAEWAMYRLGDLSTLAVLVGIPASMAAVIWAYLSKSKTENQVGGIVYEATMRELDNEDAVG